MTVYIRSMGGVSRALDIVCRNKGDKNVIDVVFYNPETGKELASQPMIADR